MSRPPADDLPLVPQSAAPPAEASALRGVAGVLLAAGESSRFGEDNKLLVEVDGSPVVRRAATTLLDAGLGTVLVVIGHEAEAVRGALSGLDCAFVENPDHEEGQATSVAAGVESLLEGPVVPDAAVFALGDMPAVTPETVRRLVGAYRSGLGNALAAAFEGRRGNPVLFDAEFLPALGAVDGDRGARDILLSSERAALVETGDPGVLADVDEPADLAKVAEITDRSPD